MVPETRNQTLEELDATFSVPSRVHAMYGLRQLRWFILRYVCLQHGAKKAVLPVKLKEARSNTGEGDQDWEHRYVVFGKDTNTRRQLSMERYHRVQKVGNSKQKEACIET